MTTVVGEPCGVCERGFLISSSVQLFQRSRSNEIAMPHGRFGFLLGTAVGCTIVIVDQCSEDVDIWGPFG
jgi:hypothetical protein